MAIGTNSRFLPFLKALKKIDPVSWIEVLRLVREINDSPITEKNPDHQVRLYENDMKTVKVLYKTAFLGTELCHIIVDIKVMITLKKWIAMDGL